MSPRLADTRLSAPAVAAPARALPEPAVPAFGLVARDRELSEIERALGHCRLGGSTLVVLRGEPGTGKTALIAAAAMRARDFQTLVVRGTPDPGAPPADWPAPLAELLSRCDGEDAGTAAALAGSALERIAAIDGVPLLVAIDDAELLPLRFLQALASSVEQGIPKRPTLLLLGVQDLPHVCPHPLSIAPMALNSLRGLTLEQASGLLERVLGRAPSPALARPLVHAVGGNPAAVLSVGATLDDDVLGGWAPLPDPVPLNPSQRRTYGACLERLPSETRRALCAAAAGRIPRKVLDAALGTLELAPASLEPAVELGIVVVQRSRISFAHPLVRAAAYHGAADEDRRRAHAALSQAFAASGLVEQAADHARRGGAAGTTVVGLYGQAVRVALDRADLPLAARYQERMADLSGTDESALQHLSRAAAWWLAAGEPARAAHCLDLAAGLPAPEDARGPLVYWRSRARMAEAADPRVAEDLAAAAGTVANGASGSAALMLGEAAVCVLVAGSARQAGQLAAAAVDAATAGGFPGAFADAVATSVRVLGQIDPGGADELRRATSFLMSQPDALPLSPLFALVVGLALLEQSGTSAAGTWASWLDRTAATTGIAVLHPVSRLLGAQVAIRSGELDRAAELAAVAAEEASGHGQQVIAVRALALLLQAQSLQGRYQPAFATASRLFADAADGERSLRAGAYRALAELELQRGRIPSALSWLRAAEHEVSPERAAGAEVEPRHAVWVAGLAELYVHDGRPEAVGELVELADQAARLGAIEPAWAPALRGMATDDLPDAEALLDAALRLARDEPALRSRIEFLYASRLATAGLDSRAARRIQSAVRLARDIGATGWATRFELALGQLDAPGSARPDLAVLSGGGAGEAARGASPREVPASGRDREAVGRLDPAASWEVRMLGAFNVRHADALISMPTSLAATALKLVALRRRILVDELVEELWPESAPGVGVRRLRNVLWRVRIACGDILLREDRLLLLSPEAVTDVEVFRRLAVQALDPSTPQDKSDELARSALAQYGGELLPADRYADWAATTRESLARLQIQLVELRVQHALAEERTHEALGLLDQLIEADPYEESNYLRAAEIHERTGNRRRALAALGRAERTLADLGIPPSPDLQRLSQRLR